MRKIFEITKNEKGSSTGETIWGLLCLGLIIWAVFALIGHFTQATESEGTVKYDDCRQIITTAQGSSDTWGKNFTCTNFKAKSGRLISGTCVHIETENGICTKAYVYEKKSDFNCGKNSTPNYDDSVYACTCNEGYHPNPTDSRKPCVVDNSTISPTPSDIYFPNNNDMLSTQNELAPIINVDSNPKLSVKLSKLIGNYATGTIGNGYTGSVWYAVKIDGQWKEVWTGQNIISCKPVQQYNIPKAIYVGPDGASQCSNNY